MKFLFQSEKFKAGLIGLAFISWFLIPFSSLAAVIDVPSDYPTIQSALNNCSQYDTIYVQPGTYLENIVWPDKAGIKLLAAGDSSNTIIDGNQLGRVLTFSEESIDTTTVVKGFKITNGYLEGEDDMFGAGVYLDKCGVKLEEICISGNHLFGVSGTDGAGLHSEESNLVFRNSKVQFNYIDSAEGASAAALMVIYGDYLYLENLEILHNRIEFGGGIGAVSIEGDGELYVNVRNCKVMFNSVNNCGSKYSGAIAFKVCLVMIDNLIVDSNDSGSGGSWYFGGGLSFNDVECTAVDLTVSHNMTGDSGGWYYGGGIYIEESEISLTNLIVEGNISGNEGASYYGGGLYIDGSNVSITNGLIVNNQMGLGGNGYGGGGIKARGGSAYTDFTVIINTTVARNRRKDESEIGGSGIMIQYDVNLDCLNSVFWNPNTYEEVIIQGDAFAYFDYCDIRDGFTGTGNINADPLFVSDSDFHLSATSPCLGIGKVTGAPAFDIDGSQRPLPAGTNPDLGCYEMDIAVENAPIEMESHMFIHPNPACEFAELYYDFRNNGELVIKDITSNDIYRAALRSSQKKHHLWIDKIPPGIYFISIYDGETTMSEKLIIQH